MALAGAQRPLVFVCVLRIKKEIRPCIAQQARVFSALEESVRRGANEAWQLGLSDSQLAQFARYGALLAEWNATRLNLTRITTPEGIAVKHFLDSLAVLYAASIPRNARMIDVGTGAGLPGLALKIARPDLALTLLDATAKKLAFCRAVADDLGFADVQSVHARAEDAGRQPEYAGRFDVAVARAVAPLETLLPWLVPFVRPGGLVIALKSVHVDDELPAARRVARRLGVALTPPLSLFLPEADEPTERRIVLGVCGPAGKPARS
jgi:16S rRNA (guanine527-N7)-methyltransferase